jgi:hypothetical protein
LWRNEIVVHHDVGEPEIPQPLHCYEVWVARASADQIHSG